MAGRNLGWMDGPLAVMRTGSLETGLGIAWRTNQLTRYETIVLCSNICSTLAAG